MGFQSTSDDRHRSTQETKDNFSSIDGPFFCALFCCCKNIRSLIDVTTTKNKGNIFKRRTTTAREDKQWRCSSAKSNNNKNVPGWRDFWKLNYSNHFHNFLLHKLCACVWMLVLGHTKSARKKQTDTTIQRGSDIDKNRKNESRQKKKSSPASLLFAYFPYFLDSFIIITDQNFPQSLFYSANRRCWCFPSTMAYEKRQKKHRTDDDTQ